MKTTPVWRSGESARVCFPPLEADVDVDVVVIGGGITGITAANLLTKSGLDVVVLEALSVGGGTTGCSTGNLYATVDKQVDHIRKKFDKDTARLVVESRTAAMDLIEGLVTEHQLACDFQRVPFFHIAELEGDEASLDRELAASVEAGLTASMVGADGVPLPFPMRRAMRLEAQAQIDPLRYVVELALATASARCRIYEQTKVVTLDEADGRCTVTTANGHTVRAGHALMATHTPKGIMFVQTLLGAYREYAVAVTLRDGAYPPPGTYWTMADGARHSIRHMRNAAREDFLLVLGEPHKVGQEDDNIELLARLERYVRERFDVAEVMFRWGAQHYRPADGLPYIGPRGDDSHVHIATGFSTDGLVYGTLAAMITRDHITGRVSPWAHTYRFGRHTPLKSAAAWIKENANVALQYLKDLPGHVDVARLDAIGRGEGATVAIDGQKCGAYRDDAGELHVVSAVCTHMACILGWNRAERTWDCPCHGSRFRTDGTVIEGPALADLPRIPVRKVLAQVADERAPLKEGPS